MNKSEKAKEEKEKERGGGQRSGRSLSPLVLGYFEGGRGWGNSRRGGGEDLPPVSVKVS